MKILITGGAGFIGTHLSRQLLKNGHHVVVLDNFLQQVHAGIRDVAGDLSGKVQLIAGDVADADVWTQAMDGVDVVVHLAAETGTGQSMYEVRSYERTNVSGTAQLFDFIVNKKNQVKKIVLASSRAIYGEGKYRCRKDGVVYPLMRRETDLQAGLFECRCPICNEFVELQPTDEQSQLNSTSYYALSKLHQEQMVMLFCQTLKIDGIALRYQNVYGPGQSLVNPYTGILAIFSGLGRRGEKINIFEDGLESRDFVYIGDVVDATAAACEAKVTGQHVMNIGSGVRTSVLDVVNAIQKHYAAQNPHKSPTYTISGQFRLGDIRHNVADISKAKKILGFTPKWSFNEGLTAFLQWADQQHSDSSRYAESLAESKRRGLLKGGKPTSA